jgi:peroxiredoxin
VDWRATTQPAWGANREIEPFSGGEIILTKPDRQLHRADHSMLSKRLLLLTLLVLAVGCGGKDAARDVSTTSNAGLANAPDFASVDMHGVPFRLSDQRGKVVLINFFATWCAPCLIEMPHLKRIYETNKDKGFVLVIVSAEGMSARADVRAFGIRQELNFPLILDDDLHISALLNPKKAAPFSVLIDRAGRIILERDGYNPGDEVALAQDVATAVGRPAASASN